jgi:hypothetical protein
MKKTTAADKATTITTIGTTIAIKFEALELEAIIVAEKEPDEFEVEVVIVEEVSDPFEVDVVIIEPDTLEVEVVNVVEEEPDTFEMEVVIVEEVLDPLEVDVVIIAEGCYTPYLTSNTV